MKIILLHSSSVQAIKAENHWPPLFPFPLARTSTTSGPNTAARIMDTRASSEGPIQPLFNRRNGKVLRQSSAMSDIEALVMCSCFFAMEFCVDEGWDPVRNIFFKLFTFFIWWGHKIYIYIWNMLNKKTKNFMQTINICHLNLILSNSLLENTKHQTLITQKL